MKLRKIISFKIALLFFCLFLYPRSAFAYLDPGTGSYIFQIVIAGLLGAAFAVKVFWIKIKSFLMGVFSKQKKDD